MKLKNIILSATVLFAGSALLALGKAAQAKEITITINAYDLNTPNPNRAGRYTAQFIINDDNDRIENHLEQKSNLFHFLSVQNPQLHLGRLQDYDLTVEVKNAQTLNLWFSRKIATTHSPRQNVFGFRRRNEGTPVAPIVRPVANRQNLAAVDAFNTPVNRNKLNSHGRFMFKRLAQSKDFADDFPHEDLNDDQIRLMRAVRRAAYQYHLKHPDQPGQPKFKLNFTVEKLKDGDRVNYTEWTKYNELVMTPNGDVYNGCDEYRTWIIQHGDPITREVVKPEDLITIKWKTEE